MKEEDLKAHLLKNYPKENSSCEWKGFTSLKGKMNGKAGEDVISYVSGIANMDGGCLVIGIKDQSAEIIGIDNFHDYTPENTPQRLIGNCSNLSSEGLYVESITTSDTKRTVWIIHIPKHLPRKPVYAHKAAWQRTGDSLTKLSSERENAILSELLHQREDWSVGVCSGASIYDLDEAAILKARENYKIKYPHLGNDVDVWDDATFLNKAKITINGQITRTAILLLGKSQADHFISPVQAKITWIIKNKDNVELDYEHFHIPFILNVDNLFAKIRNLKYRYLKDETLFPEEVLQYEPYVIREAIHNCIAHQDYNLGGRIYVIEMPESLIFSNSGTFLPGTVEDVIKTDAPYEISRNPFLSEAMFNMNMIDIIGSGIKRMFNFQKQRFFPLPEYDLSDIKVKVTIYGKVLDLEYARVLARNPDLNLEEIILLDKVQKRKKLSKEEARYLKRRKLIEGRSPNFHLSSRLAAKTGQKAYYIKKRGFTYKKYKEMILEFLDKFSLATRKDIDDILNGILPDVKNEKQKKDMIKNLLYSMSHYDESIINVGTIRNPIYKKNIYYKHLDKM